MNGQLTIAYTVNTGDEYRYRPAAAGYSQEWQTTRNFSIYASNQALSGVPCSPLHTQKLCGHYRQSKRQPVVVVIIDGRHLPATALTGTMSRTPMILLREKKEDCERNSDGGGQYSGAIGFEFPQFMRARGGTDRLLPEGT